MPDLNINVPSIKQSFYDVTQSKANKEKVEKVIRPKFGKIIDSVSYISNVPSSLIESFIFIESAGNPNAQSPYATGLMQLSPATASDVIVKEKGTGRLTDAEAQILKKCIPSKWSMIENVKKGQTSLGKTFITNEELLKPEFNVLVGTMLLKQLIDEFTASDKVVRMDKVITIYNAGRYGSTSKAVMASNGTIEDVMKIVPKETSAYILKLVGQRGLLDTLA